jgi:hypothetical protein
VTATADGAIRLGAWYDWEITPVMDLSDVRTIEFLLTTATFHD